MLLEEPYVPSPIPSGDRVQIKIRLNLPFAECDFATWLISLINKLIWLVDPSGEMEVIAVAPGSVVITLEMDDMDARKTIGAFGTGELEELGIASIATNFGAGEPAVFTAIAKAPAQNYPVPPRPEPPSQP
jgi:hypothetical protein